MEHELSIIQIREILKRKINDRNNVNYVESTSKYFYLAGQVVYFLLSKDKRRLKQTQDISKFIRCKDIQKLKQNIIQFNLQICACFPLDNYKFNNAYGLINNYLENSAFDGNLFMGGFTSLNLISKSNNS